MLRNLLIVGAGGFFGSIARYALAKAVQERIDGSFPWGTFSVNVLGCLCIGILYGLGERQGWMQGTGWLLLATGFCGGFTTFSTLTLENLKLAQAQLPLQALLYSALSLMLGYACCWAGWRMAR